MDITFLGTNGWYATNNGNTSCVFVDTKDYYLIFDAGDGIYKIDELIKKKKPIMIFLSHLHFDHILGIHVLAKFGFEQTIHIYGAKGTESNLNKIIQHPFTVPFQNLPSKVEVHDLNSDVKFPFAINYLPLKHSDYCLGYQVIIDEKVLTYATDTGICNNLYNLR
jgi:ribonuclease BN (tRNA processing enzyme)